VSQHADGQLVAVRILAAVGIGAVFCAGDLNVNRTQRSPSADWKQESRAMTPERWRRIGELYQAALALAEGGRNALLDQACAGDEELRRQVESLRGLSTIPATTCRGGR
jgi:hypothetical protein